MARDMKKGIQLLNFEVGMSPVLHPFPAFFLQNKKKKRKKKNLATACSSAWAIFIPAH